MIGRKHLHDGRLHDCYLAARAGQPVDPRAAEHLADCPPCAWRYRELTAFLQAIDHEGAIGADEVFTIDKLQRQHDAILHRLEHASRSARVISFPRSPATSGAAASSRIATRWIGAAAAAGLFVGVAVGGAFLPPRSALAPATTRGPAGPGSVRVNPAGALVGTPPTAAGEPLDDDRFLLDLEAALQRPNTRELLSFDNLTPHAREVTNRVR